MSEFHDDYPQYEMMAHHSEEDGARIRKKLWRVFWIMLAVTLVELFVGFQAKSWGVIGTTGLISFFIFFTIVKAYYIVFAFMHLGDEKKIMPWVIVAPFSCFIIYLAFMASVGEGSYSMKHRQEMDKQIIMQQLELKQEGSNHEGGAAAEEHEAAGQKKEENHHE
jgi:cytochrome c oxidase subunit 4